MYDSAKRSIDAHGLTHCRLEEGDGTYVDVIGYYMSRWKSSLCYAGYLFTFGMLKLIFFWMPQWGLKCTHNVCPLSKAQKVLVKDSHGVYYTHHIKIASIDGIQQNVSSKFLLCETGAISRDWPFLENYTVFFHHKRLKYMWDIPSETFIALSGWEERPNCDIVPAKPITNEEVINRRALYDSNDIIIRLTPIIQILLKQCLHPIYVFQLFSCILWFAEDYWKYAICILILSVMSIAMQTYEIHTNEISLRKTVCGSSMVNVVRNVNNTEECQEINSVDLVPGDVIEISRRGCLMQCDALLLTGNCIVNESTLTGESVPITKIPFVQSADPKEIFNIRTYSRNVLFGGTSVIQTRNYANEHVLAVVLRTGFCTTKGELVRSILFPKPVKFKFTQDAFKFIGALAGVALIGFSISIYFMYVAEINTLEMLLHSLDVITVVVPPALPLAMTVGVLFSQTRLKKLGIYCINSSVISVCGVINVTCFDKTGTLTEDGLDLWGVLPVNEGLFDEPEMEPSRIKYGPLVECMASCHSLTVIEGVLCGDPLDLKMFQSTNWEFTEEVSEDHCKFEMAIPAIVRPNPRLSMTNVTLDTLIDSDALPYEVGVLRQFPFSSSLQRMSVVARVLNGSHFSLYTKGAPETIEALCRRDTVPSDFHSNLLDYTREGYRVLALAWRPVKSTYNRVMRVPRERLELDLIFLGLLVMENRLKPESAPVIKTLRRANIRPIMVTGDNMLTAVSVARDCEMIDELDRIIIVSAKPPPNSSGDHDESDSPTTADGDVKTGQNASETVEANANVPLFVTVYSQADGSSAVDGSQCSEQHSESLVKFHYAEDLHKPVTEVTTTHGSVISARSHPRSNVERCGSADRSWLSRWLPRRRKKRNDGSCPSVIRDGIPSNGTTTHPSLTVPVDVPYGSDLLNTAGSQQHPSNFNRRVTDFADNLVDQPTQHSVNIRMLDRSDFHLAVSGKTWSVIKEHFPLLIPKIVVKGTIFARFSPDQKAQLIEALQSVGYYVAMCGDGANDCGALKAAHAGIALSEAEASVASPFTSKQHDVGCVPMLIKDGRCALVTSFGVFKFMAGYSMVQFISVLMLQSLGSTITDGQFLYIDLFLITTLSITFGYTKPYHRLSVEPPVVRLLSIITLLSMGFQVIVAFGIQLLAFQLVRQQPWFMPHEADTEVDASIESTAVFIVASYQYIFLALVFSKGAPYRQTLISNRYFTINVVAALVFNAYITSYPCSWLLGQFELFRLPSLRFLLILQALALINFFVSYLLEMIIDGVLFRKRLSHIRRVLFPRRVARKDYECIRDDIDRMAGGWPRIIHSASIQALPKELFTECDAAVLPNRTRSRRRCTSGISSDTDEEGGEHSVVTNRHSGESGSHRRPVFDGVAVVEEEPQASQFRAKHAPRQRTPSRTKRRRHSYDDTGIRLLTCGAPESGVLQPQPDLPDMAGADDNPPHYNSLVPPTVQCDPPKSGSGRKPRIRSQSGEPYAVI